MADEQDKSWAGRFGDMLLRAGEGAIDGLANSRSVAGGLLGGALQSGFETSGYRDREAERQLRDRKMRLMDNQMAEMEADKPLRDAERERALMEHEEWKGAAPDRELDRSVQRMANEETIAGAPTRAAQREAARVVAEQTAASAPLMESERRMAIMENDSQYRKQMLERGERGLDAQMANNPLRGQFTDAEWKAAKQSPAVQAMLEGQYYLNELMLIGQRDPAAQGRMEREIAAMGWEVTFENGVPVLDMGEYGRVAGTPEEIGKLQRQIGERAAGELQTRGQFALNNTIIEPLGSIIRSRAEEAAPYYGNDYTATIKDFDGLMRGMSPDTQVHMVMNHLVKLWKNPNVPHDVKLAQAEKGLPFLSQIGKRIEFQDPKNPDLSTAVMYDLVNNRRYIGSEIEDYFEQMDEGGRMLDRMAKQKREAFEQAAQEKVMEQIRALNEAANTPEAQQRAKEEEERQRREQTQQDLHETYRGEFVNLPVKEQQKLGNAWNAFIEDAQLYAIDESTDDLEVLRELEENWRKLADREGFSPERFYSPVNNRILQLELDELQEQLAETGRQIKREEEHFQYEEESFGRRVEDDPRNDRPPNSTAHRSAINNLERQIAKLQGEIDSRHDTLRKRGVGQTEEDGHVG